jgi:hypothetical protein
MTTADGNHECEGWQMRYLSGNQDGAHWHLISPEKRVINRLWFPSPFEARRSLENFVHSLRENPILATPQERGVLVEALTHLEVYFDKEINKAQTLAMRSRVNSFEHEEKMDRFQSLVSRREILQGMKARINPHNG